MFYQTSLSDFHVCDVLQATVTKIFVLSTEYIVIKPMGN